MLRIVYFVFFVMCSFILIANPNKAFAKLDLTINGKYILSYRPPGTITLVNPTFIRYSNGKVYYSSWSNMEIHDSDTRYAWESNERLVIDCNSMMVGQLYLEQILGASQKRLQSSATEQTAEWRPALEYEQQVIAIPLCDGGETIIEESLLKNHLSFLNTVDITDEESILGFMNMLKGDVTKKGTEDLIDIIKLMILGMKLSDNDNIKGFNFEKLASTYGENPESFKAADGTYKRLRLQETDQGDNVGIYEDGYDRLIYLNGGINKETYDIVSTILEKEKIDFIYFNSPGGLLDIGIELGKKLREKDIITAVRKGDTCGSACALAFLGGTERTVYDAEALVFHSPYYLYEDKKVSLDRTSREGKAVLAYIKQLTGEAAGESLFHAMMSTTRSVTYSMEELRRQEYITAAGDGYVDVIVAQVPAKEEASDEVKWYYDCVLADNFLGGYLPKGQQYAQYSKNCWYRQLPSNHKWIKLKYLDVKPDAWPFTSE